VDSENSEYEVYCHFDSDGAWTLVQSYTFANKDLHRFKKSLSVDSPVNKDDPNWRKYRLSKSRMRSIKANSTFVQFTCDYDKVINFSIKKSDYLQIPLQKIIKNGKSDVILDFSGYTSYITISRGCGAIGEYNLTDCNIWLHQETNNALHVHVSPAVPGWKFDSSCTGYRYNYFGSFGSPYNCMKQLHRCVQKDDSTTQFWFGTRKFDTEQTSGGNAENPGSYFSDSGNTEQHSYH
jgi:hypothetical protein